MMNTITNIAGAILVLRGQRVLLDSELAALYEITTKRFNEQVRRNRDRFPEDFMFQLTAAETELSRSQIATLNGGRGHMHPPPPEQRPIGFTANLDEKAQRQD